MRTFLSYGLDWQKIELSDCLVIINVNKSYALKPPNITISEFITNNYDITANNLGILNCRENKLSQIDFQQTTLIMKLPHSIRHEMFPNFCADYCEFDEFIPFCKLAIEIKQKKPKKWKTWWPDRLSPPPKNDIIYKQYKHFTIFQKIELLLKMDKNIQAIIFSLFDAHLYDGVFTLLWELKLPPTFSVDALLNFKNNSENNDII